VWGNPRSGLSVDVWGNPRSGLSKLLACGVTCRLLQVNKVQGEASDIWQKMANAEQGSAVHKLYK